MKVKWWIVVIPFLILLTGLYEPGGKRVDVVKVMGYPIPQVVARYCKDYGVSKEEAKVYERELKRYLILASTYREGSLPMTSEEVDNLWHTFLLFTKEYQQFCEQSFGKFIHHVPHVEEGDVEEELG